MTTPAPDPSGSTSNIRLAAHDRYGTVIVLPPNLPHGAADILSGTGVRMHAGTARGTFAPGLTHRQQHQQADELVRRLTSAGIECDLRTPAPVNDEPVHFTDPAHGAPAAASVRVDYQGRSPLVYAAAALDKHLPGLWSTNTLATTPRWQHGLFEDLWIDGPLLWAVNEFIHAHACLLYGPDGMNLLLVAHPGDRDQWIVGAQHPRGPHRPPPARPTPLAMAVPADGRQAAELIAEHLLPAFRHAVLGTAPQPPSPTKVTIGFDAEHYTAVRAQAAGPEAEAATVTLIAGGFTPTPTGLVLARIDGEEEFYAAAAITALRSLGFAVDADPDLDPEAAFCDDWRWGNDEMPWATREEVREVGAEAQRLYEALAEGRLIVHAHARDGDRPVMLATPVGGIHTLELHGEDHLLQETRRWTNAREALEEFHHRWAQTITPGPPPPTDRARCMAAALARSARPPDTAPAPDPGARADTTGAGHGPQSSRRNR